MTNRSNVREFLGSIFGVVTASASLITVPVMIALGIEPHVAIATNMLPVTLARYGYDESSFWP